MKAEKKSWMRALFAYAEGEKKRLALSVVLSVLSVMLGLAPFYCMYRLVCLFVDGSATAAGVIRWCLLSLAVMLSISMVGSLAKLEVFSENMRQVKFTVEGLEEYLELPALPEPSQRAKIAHTGVSLKDVHFSYTGKQEDEVLHGIDLNLPEGSFTALVGPSGGEKQRIAIARMMLKNAPIVILDEATAFTDPENEDKLQRSIAALTKGKTLLVIAHRLSTIKNADNIVVLKNGAIEAAGTQEELLASCLLYKDMWLAHIGAQNWAVSAAKKEA